MHFKTAVALGDVAMVPKSTVNEGWNGGVWLALWRCLFRWESAALWTADGCVRLDHAPVGLSSGGASTSVIDFALVFGGIWLSRRLILLLIGSALVTKDVLQSVISYILLPRDPSSEEKIWGFCQVFRRSFQAFQ